MHRFYIPIVCALCIGATPCLAASDVAQAESDARIEQRLQDEIDLALKFNDENGKTVTLKDVMLPGRPAIITPVYYMCPRLCTFTLNGTVALLNRLDLKLGEDFNVISFTINPEEDSNLAKRKAAAYYEELADKESGRKGWRFLSGHAESISKLTSQLGFHYKREGSDYIHAATIVVVTPQGKIARYFFGIDYPPQEVRLSLVDAARGKIGSLVDRAFLFCFRYDHLSGRYSLIIWNVVRAFSIGCAVLLFTFLISMRLKEAARHA